MLHRTDGRLVVIRNFLLDMDISRKRGVRLKISLCIFNQGSNFSARGLKSATERSNLIIFRNSVKLVTKYFVYGVGGRGKTGLKSAT